MTTWRIHAFTPHCTDRAEAAGLANGQPGELDGPPELSRQRIELVGSHRMTRHQ
jgi:hypothetical protein